MTRLLHYYGWRAIFGLAVVPAMCGCGRSGLDEKPWHEGEVEVSPSIFIQVDERSSSSDDAAFFPKHQKFSETVELRIHWGGTIVTWKGNSGPVNLRSLEGRLFLITLDRVSKGADQSFFRYYAQESNQLREIPPGQFPKAIAGQNLDFSQRYFGGLTEQLDAVQIARDQDPRDIYFRNELTAQIWCHLTTGEQYWQSSGKEISQRLLEDFIRTNKPIKLTAIIRESGEARARDGAAVGNGR